MMHHCEVVVVGGGPAGSVMAALLAAEGHDVLLADRSTFPRQKACGECINPGAVAALDRLGLLSDILRERPSPIRGWLVNDPDGSRMHGVFRTGSALGMSRAVFDHRLLTHGRQRGVNVIEGFQVRTLQRSGDNWVITGRRHGGTHTVRAKFLVGADGLRSVVARRLGLVAQGSGIRKTSVTFRVRGTGPDRTQGQLTVTDDMTLGLAPVHADTPCWNATMVVPAGASARRFTPGMPDIVADTVRAHFPWHTGPELIGPPLVSGPFDWPGISPVTDGAVLVGDAAGYFDPFTGQGIYRALRTAELAAPVVSHALLRGRPTAKRLTPYRKALRRELRGPRFLQHTIDAVMRRGPVRRAALRMLADRHFLTDRLIALTGDVRSSSIRVHPTTLTQPT